MKLTFLGGANEVGASCTLLEVAGKRILIDAGIRMGAKEADRLPNLAQIQDGGPLDAILLTHAHTDHIGALPLVHIAYPRIPIFTTAPTKRLTQILLSDALRIMESRWQQEKEIPLYPEHTVTAMLAQFQLIEPGQPFAVCGPDIAATFALSGHVLGACSVMLDTPDGRLFHTGDYSLDRQQTVEGMLIPRGRPDLVITESTYGNRMHANRQVEEQRLVQCVAEIIANNGKVLIPAFALGRAQEAILLLVEAQRKKRIPAFPIYIDGMVRTVCSAYASFPEFLTRDLRKRISTIGNPFFHEGAHTVAVQAPQRQAILDDAKPCCIISSSGMLTGGPSQFYAAALATDPKNAIYITGYQDEESPGRRVLDLADGKSRTIRFGDQEVEVACKVGRYNLSAHADSAQMLGVLSKLGPKDVYLVHGDAGARTSLADAVSAQIKVHLPNNGQSFEHSYRARKLLKIVEKTIGAGEPFDAEKLRQHLGTRFYSIAEIAALWFGSDYTPEQFQAVQSTFDLKPAGYTQSNGLYRRTPDPVTPAAKKRPQRLEQNQALQLVDHLFPGQPDLYRKSVLAAQGELVLSFHFPSVALERYSDRFQEISQKSGWKVSLTPGVHQGALMTAVQAMLPPDCRLLKTPSLHLQEKRVVAKVHAPDLDFTPIQARFLEATGHQLQIETANPSTNAPSPKPGAKIEINQAFARIRQAFLERKIPLFRCSLKEDTWIELALISPQVARRHEDLRARLESEVSWPLRFASEPNQDLIKKQVKGLIPSDWGLLKEPAFFKADGLVQVTLSQPPPLEAVKTLSQTLEEETGYRLGFKVRP